MIAKPHRKGSLLVLVPAVNEQAAIGRVVQGIRESAPGVPVVVVDDCSKDATVASARAAGAQVLRLPFHLGLGGAVQAGYRLAFELGFDFVIRLDGDGQHDPQFIPNVLEELKTSGCEMVIASRFEDGPGANPEQLIVRLVDRHLKRTEPGHLGFVHANELVRLLGEAGFEQISLRRLHRQGFVIALARKS